MNENLLSAAPLHSLLFGCSLLGRSSCSTVRTLEPPVKNPNMKAPGKIHYGYVIMLCCFLIMFVLVGLIMSCAGIFYKPVSETLGIEVRERRLRDGFPAPSGSGNPT